MRCTPLLAAGAALMVLVGCADPAPHRGAADPLARQRTGAQARPGHPMTVAEFDTALCADWLLTGEDVRDAADMYFRARYAPHLHMPGGTTGLVKLSITTACRRSKAVPIDYVAGYVLADLRTRFPDSRRGLPR